MARVNFRSVRDRFTHIDAEFVDVRIGLSSGRFEFIVRFYPWWEHPQFLESHSKDLPWKFADTSAGAKEVTVWPINLREFRISAFPEVTDWAFLEEHPLLWTFEDSEQIYCNGNVDIASLIDRIVDRNLPFVSRDTIYRYVDPLLRWEAPYSLGRFPTTLFQPLVEELRAMNVPLFIPREPKHQTTPVILLIDGFDYIIADDFELDVPDFDHRPEWFVSG